MFFFCFSVLRVPFEFEDPYQIFGIPYDATDAAIKSAYRKLSLKVHPDRCPGQEQGT